MPEPRGIETIRMPAIAGRRMRMRHLKRMAVALTIATLVGATATAYVLWDDRAASMPSNTARTLADSADARSRVAAIVTMLRESHANITILLRLAEDSDPAVREQARLALHHLREQLR